MRARAALAVACAALTLGCGRAAPPSPRASEDPQRQKVRAFWQALNAATEVRLRHDCRGASGLYEQALAIDPRHEDALYYLGQCRRDLGRPVEARAAFERLVEVNPQSARGHLALGSLLASPDEAEPMDAAAAELHLRRAHEINGEETGPMVRLGEVLLVTGRAEEAGRWFESALRTNPKSVEAAFLAGFIAWQSGHGGDATRLAGRVRDTARVDAPVKGVLNEGDRKDPARVAAPPLKSPLGRTLFGEFAGRIRGRAAGGEPLGDAGITELWREMVPVRQRLAARAAASSAPVAAAAASR